MREAQKNKCFICQKEKTLVIDHDHETNAVRKLLCNRCNTFVGFLETSDPVLVRRVLKYAGLNYSLWRNCIDSFTPRNPVNLSVVEGLNHSEAARQLNVSYMTVIRHRRSAGTYTRKRQS